MRLYAPADTPAVLADLLAEPSIARGVVHHAVLPGSRADLRGRSRHWLDPRIVAGLAGRGIERPYIHQAEALSAVHAGEDVVVVTPTASGKSLCYTLPDPAGHRGRPGIARAHAVPDQGARPGPGRRSSPRSRPRPACPVSASTYDGDTPAPIRSAVRSAGQVVVTNPDMLHAAILPHHTKWFQLFEQLKVIVIDELHSYRGVFGGHVANVLRRLLRICAHYGSHPVIVCCSATIGNPAELAAGPDRSPVATDRPDRRPGRRTARAARGSAAARSGDRGPRFGRDARPALGPAVPAGRSPDHRLRAIASRRGAAPDRSARVASRGPRPAHAAPRLPRRLPAHGAARHRTRPARRRDPRGRRDQRAGAGRGHRPPGCRHRRGLPGLGGSDLAAVRAGGPSAGRQRRGPDRLVGARRPVRRPPPGVPARGLAGGGPGGPGQPARPAGAPAGGRVRAAVRARRPVRVASRRTTSWRSSPRTARSVRPATDAGTGRARTSRPRRYRCGRPPRRTS